MFFVFPLGFQCFLPHLKIIRRTWEMIENVRYCTVNVKIRKCFCSMCQWLSWKSVTSNGRVRFPHPSGVEIARSKLWFGCSSFPNRKKFLDAVALRKACERRIRWSNLFQRTSPNEHAPQHNVYFAESGRPNRTYLGLIYYIRICDVLHKSRTDWSINDNGKQYIRKFNMAAIKTIPILEKWVGRRTEQRKL